jgi:hypothetical protein
VPEGFQRHALARDPDVVFRIARQVLKHAEQGIRARQSRISHCWHEEVHRPPIGTLVPCYPGWSNPAGVPPSLSNPVCLPEDLFKAGLPWVLGPGVSVNASHCAEAA